MTHLGSLLGPGGLISCSDDGGKTWVKREPIDVRDMLAAGAELVFLNDPARKKAEVAEEETKPFDFASLDKDALKALYGQAMSEGVELPAPPGAAGVKWFSERLAESGWQPPAAAGQEGSDG